MNPAEEDVDLVAALRSVRLEETGYAVLCSAAADEIERLRANIQAAILLIGKL